MSWLSMYLILGQTTYEWKQINHTSINYSLILIIWCHTLENYEGVIHLRITNFLGLEVSCHKFKHKILWENVPIYKKAGKKAIWDLYSQ